MVGNSEPSLAFTWEGSLAALVFTRSPPLPNPQTYTAAQDRPFERKRFGNLAEITTMRLYVVLFILMVLCPVASAQKTSSIEWGKPITYTDFEASPVKEDTAAANISVTILLGYSSSKSGALRFRVVAVMDKDQSWMKEQFKRNHILKHEQGHFDIAQIYAKKLEADLKRKHYTSEDVQSLNDLYDRYLEEMNSLQIRYDRETKGGWDALAQSKWRLFIQDELQRIK